MGFLLYCSCNVSLHHSMNMNTIFVAVSVTYLFLIAGTFQQNGYCVFIVITVVKDVPMCHYKTTHSLVIVVVHYDYYGVKFILLVL